ncbi:MAG: NADH-quinone oxidoreductase subunit L [Acidobacteria bacterium]|nr:MAG: NADH-quinone oxidoreductase subunit L [Acidobacteriota bacterium]
MNQDDLANIAVQTKQNDSRYDHVIKVCVAAGCLSANSEQVKTQLESEVKQRGLEGCCKVKGVGCMGLCAAGPLVANEGNEKMFQSVTPADAAAIIDDVVDHKPAPSAIVMDSNLDFFKRQKKIVLENSGEIDPERIEDYIAADGYEALFHVITMLNPAEVIEQITKSGLRGRGGAGFPTGLKWITVAKASGNRKYVICNADEGDPGAFMDRSVLESDPHRVLEGMAIAGYAVGAEKGFIYCRAEYPLAVKRLRVAIREAENIGLLGLNIGDTHFDFKVEVRLGAGAFVCGEETALIASIEGGRGTPRPRPPFPAQQGLWGDPTLINNVETFANIPPIIRRGGEWFASIGTEKSKGTKVFALAGRVKNTGLIEVPMGVTLREIIFKLGGGIPDGRRFKAVQSGGPSGGCVPEQYLDIPVDYDSLASVGSIMGSGGMIVMDDTSCMVDVARFFMDFCMSESCGKCVPCRVGTTQMHNILDRITKGKAGPKDLELLQRLTGMVKAASLCGLGQTAPNPTLTTLRYFMDEYRAHIEEGRCPAGVCHPAKAEAEVSA